MEKNENKAISVIVPFYNSINNLKHCVKCLTEQSVNSELYEVIFVDDGSNDNSSKFLLKILEISNFHYKLIKHSKNLGPGAARNSGIEAAVGTYLFFLDSDDSLKSNVLEKLLAAATANDADFVFADTYWKVGKINRRSGNYSFKKSGLIAADDVSKSLQMRIRDPNRKNDIVGSKAKLIKNSLLKINKINFSERMRYLEDELFAWDVLGYSRTVYYLKNQLYVYNESSAPSTVSLSLIDNFSVFYFDQIHFKIKNCFKNRGFNKEQCVIEANQGTGYFIINILISLSKSIALNKVNVIVGKKKLKWMLKEIGKNEKLMASVCTYKKGKNESSLLILSLRYKMYAITRFLCMQRAKKLISKN